MNTQTQKAAYPTRYIERAEIVSKPGAKITVTRLRLTQAGRAALTTGSTGITTGVPENDSLFDGKHHQVPA
ncbi:MULTISPECIES: sulfatase [unclassified Achromobacter]|uniref:sulfatase n=1 Tax=unclassified Achromobacter TaxID=2626865 RepID=UPI000B51AA88|nr:MULTISPECIES: sulfatase [unclassified Achromobacter]OWT75620.1 sulfatase [Achromobacter sp. HZ28]OWT76281.1 sulfatase [Achromobacter sp. HZ34]